MNCDKSEFLRDSSFIEFDMSRRWVSSYADIRECFHTKEYFYIRVACSLISKINLFSMRRRTEKKFVFQLLQHLLRLGKWKITRRKNKKDYHFLLSMPFPWKSIEINVKMIVINVEYMQNNIQSWCFEKRERNKKRMKNPVEMEWRELNAKQMWYQKNAIEKLNGIMRY